jgi:hypothetical protein
MNCFNERTVLDSSWDILWTQFCLADLEHGNHIHGCYKRQNQFTYESVSKSFRSGHLERELQVTQLSATRCSCIAILWVSLMSFAAITFVLLLNECLLL